MGMLLYLSLSTLGGWMGWALGARFGFMAAFFVSLIGTAVGVYFARRISRTYFS